MEIFLRVLLAGEASCIVVVPEDWGAFVIGGFPAALAPCHKSLFLADFKLQVPECIACRCLPWDRRVH